MYDCKCMEKPELYGKICDCKDHRKNCCLMTFKIKDYCKNKTVHPFDHLVNKIIKGE